MRLAIIGTGNVGANLLLHVSRFPNVNDIQLLSIRRHSAESALLDAASACPDVALKARIVDSVDADLVVLSAGLQPSGSTSLAELLDTNVAITNNVLNHVKFSPGVLLITVATPVDIVTKIVQQNLKLPVNHVIGFGGDLDRNRLRFSLQHHGIYYSECTIVGEHGRNAIPVYTDELDFERIAGEVRDFLRRISGGRGAARNLASGELLARLVESIAEDRRRVHCVTCYHPQLGDWFTWPCIVGRSGVTSLQSPTLGPLAAAQLETLIQARRKQNTNR